MAEVIWTEPAILDLDAIVEYIALDKPIAASQYATKVFDTIERLEDFPDSGKKVVELPDSIYREVNVPPCRIFYKRETDKVYILHVMRSERLLRLYLLENTVTGE